jgi:hypothetical protein
MGKQCVDESQGQRTPRQSEERVLYLEVGIFKVMGSGIRAQGLGFWVIGYGIWVLDLGFRV